MLLMATRSLCECCRVIFLDPLNPVFIRKPYICPLLCSAKFREDLLRIAKTTLSSKILSQDKVHFAELAVDAVLRLQVSVAACCVLCM